MIEEAGHIKEEDTKFKTSVEDKNQDMTEEHRQDELSQLQGDKKNEEKVQESNVSQHKNRKSLWILVGIIVLLLIMSRQRKESEIIVNEQNKTYKPTMSEIQHKINSSSLSGVSDLSQQKQTEKIEQKIKQLKKEQRKIDHLLEKIKIDQSQARYNQEHKYQREQIPGFECRINYFGNWTADKANAYISQNGFRFEKVPYPTLTLVQDAEDDSPRSHFTELVALLRDHPAKQSIYIHSAPVYAVLLIAAISSSDVSIIIAHDYPNKYLLITGFVVNDIYEKLTLEQKSQRQISLERAEFIITTSTSFAKSCLKDKAVIFIVEESATTPSRQKMQKVENSQQCGYTKIVPDDRAILDQGIYLNLPLD